MRSKLTLTARHGQAISFKYFADLRQTVFGAQHVREQCEVYLCGARNEQPQAGAQLKGPPRWGYGAASAEPAPTKVGGVQVGGNRAVGD